MQKRESLESLSYTSICRVGILEFSDQNKWELSLYKVRIKPKSGSELENNFTMGMWETGVVNAKMFIYKNQKCGCFDHNIVIK